ncbi:MAG: 50S ribosomal protein L13 [Deltaproteobacteria bacterium]|nr:50S ribosomal protein L13 [Deltaproteobacteria bacterium]
MKTFNPKEVKQDWYLVDAEKKVLGRVASEIASVLRGKNKPIFTPHLDAGDFVIVVNADKIRLTGKKLTDKIYYSYSGYPGGLTEMPAGKMLGKYPTRLLHLAVRGMLPKNSLGRKMLKKLKIYAGAEHPHEAQTPKMMEI